MTTFTEDILTEDFCEMIVEDNNINIEGDVNGYFTKYLRQMLITRKLINEAEYDLKDELDKPMINGDVVMPMLEHNIVLIQELQEYCDKLKDVGEKYNINMEDKTYISMCNNNKKRFDTYTELLNTCKKKIRDCLSVVRLPYRPTMYIHFSQ